MQFVGVHLLCYLSSTVSLLKTVFSNDLKLSSLSKRPLPSVRELYVRRHDTQHNDIQHNNKKNKNSSQNKNPS
jgi:hypothetical protein